MSIKSSFRLMFHTAIMFVETSIAGSLLCPRRLRRLIYNSCGNHIETNRINAHCVLGGSRLSIGKRSFISFNCFFDLSDRITIGSDVHVAMRCLFITSTHSIGDSQRRAGESKTAPITIEDGVWIGGGATILPGVTIHKGTIIGAGSVVTKDCEMNSIYVGVPAKRIRALE